MPRPKHNRHIGWLPKNLYYKPTGIPLSALEEVSLSADEMEALRLADYEGLYQAQAAEKMQISRQTFGRVLDSARKKIASAMIEGKAIKIEGTDLANGDSDYYVCGKCQKVWPGKRHRHGQDSGCPQCE